MQNDDDIVDNVSIHDDLPLPMSSTDKMTLELLMNKSHYRKYIQKTDPTKSIEYEEHINELNKYKYDIIRLTTNLIDEPDTQINNNINKLFSEYTRELIYYFKHKQMEMDTNHNDTGKSVYKDDDDDELFGNMNDHPVKMKMTSFWGKSINFK